MKIELVCLCNGGLQLEVISETDLEFWLLKKAWELNKYERGNGRTVTPDGMSTGFYIPLCRLTKPGKK